MNSSKSFSSKTLTSLSWLSKNPNLSLVFKNPKLLHFKAKWPLLNPKDKNEQANPKDLSLTFCFPFQTNERILGMYRPYID